VQFSYGGLRESQGLMLLQHNKCCRACVVDDGSAKLLMVTLDKPAAAKADHLANTSGVAEYFRRLSGNEVTFIIQRDRF